MTLIKDVRIADRIQCGNCDVGFRRINGVHIGSQRLGMIPDTPCTRVFAARAGQATDEWPWIAYVDGKPVRKKNGKLWYYATARDAYAAARKAAPRRWHD
jgi:hypothetical protein